MYCNIDFCQIYTIFFICVVYSLHLCCRWRFDWYQIYTTLTPQNNINEEYSIYLIFAKYILYSSFMLYIVTYVVLGCERGVLFCFKETWQFLEPILYCSIDFAKYILCSLFMLCGVWAWGIFLFQRNMAISRACHVL